MDEEINIDGEVSGTAGVEMWMGEWMMDKLMD